MWSDLTQERFLKLGLEIGNIKETTHQHTIHCLLTALMLSVIDDLKDSIQCERENAIKNLYFVD